MLAFRGNNAMRDLYTGCVLVPDVTGAEFRAFREMRGLTPEQFAHEYGISVQLVKCWEDEGTTRKMNPVAASLAEFKLALG
jgi:DNA-binding transcriptional regulator YiaG